MQNAKDTFYTTLQGRLAALNPARTIVVRGTVRPGVLVEENELSALSPPVDCFRLRWAKLDVVSTSPLPLVAMTCAIVYATDVGGPRVGSACYNLGHILVLPLILLLFAIATHRHTLMSPALIWLAHIFFDRLLGYGLKYPHGFKDTHLQRVG